MEPGCKLEDFGRLVQPAATNRLRCRANVVSERYLAETQNDVLHKRVLFAFAWVIPFAVIFLEVNYKKELGSVVIW